MANEKIQINIGATDDASPKIDKLAKKIDGLESDEARIIVSADVSKLEAQLDRARTKLEGLDGDEASVQARLIGTLEQDLEQAGKLVEQLDGKVGTVKIDSVGAKRGIDDLGKSADSSKSVLANMVGNTTQDLGALGGVAGSAGVAIGQMGEYMADARAEGEGFGSIIKNFAGVAAPIAAIGLALQGITGHFKKIAAIKAFRTDQIDKYNEALRTGEGLLQAINEELTSTGKIDVQGWDGVTNIVPILADAKLKTDDWTTAVQGNEAAQQQFLATVLASGVTSAQFKDIMVALATESENYAAATKLAGDAAKVATPDIDAMWAAAKQAGKEFDDTAAAEKNAADRADELRDAFRDAKRATDELKTANQQLRDDISNDQFLLDLKDTWREVEIAGDEAMQAAVDGTLDAGIKLDDYKQKQNAAKLELLDFKDEWGSLPEAKLLPIIADIDEGSFADAESRIAVLFRNRTMSISIEQKGGTGFSLDGRLNGERR